MPLAIALLSAAALAYEILLMRLLSIVLWHHFAWMVISLALLGYGASGTFLVFARRALLARFDAAFTTLTILFSLSSLGCFAIAQRIPFNALEVLWAPRELLGLAGIYLLLAVPFFAAATAIGLSFAREPSAVPRLYRADLFGAGLGVAGILALLFVVEPDKALKVASLVALLAAFAARGRSSLKPVASGLILWMLVPSSWIAPRISEFKELSAALRMPGARIVATRTSPLGALAAVDSPAVPFRIAPGLSLNFTRSIPEQIAIFTDGGSPTAVTPPASDLSFLDHLTSALPYHLLQRPRVVVLGSGGGMEVLNALAHGARHVDAVELNRGVIELAGSVYRDRRVAVHVADARGFIERTEPAGLIQLALVDPFGMPAAGLYGLGQSDLYTVEAFERLLMKLEPGGLLAVTRWLNLPPRDTLKLVATAIEAMERRGLRDARHRIAIVRSWKTVTLLVRNGAFTGGEIETIRRFAGDRSFDVDFPPGEETNRYNAIGESALGDETVALLGPERDAFLERYKFDIAPATDDRPYFFHFFRWRVFPELAGLRARGGVFLLDLGYLVVLATLAQAIVAGAILILAPLLRFRGDRAPRRGRLVVYFGALGLGFLFIEIAFIQKLTLFLAHPIYAAALVIGAFLVFAGLGSGASRRLIQMSGSERKAVVAIGLLALAELAILTGIVHVLGGVAFPAKVLIALAVIAPMAFAMGVAFPTGIARFARDDESATSLAWGVNGCTSVASAPLATLIAMQFGFSAVILTAAALYAIAGYALPLASE